MREDKAFAPGYGEFRAQAPDELVDVAIGVPIDATPGPVPDEVATISSGAVDLFATADGDDGGNAALVDSMAAAWDAFGAGDGPELLESQMSDALDALAAAVRDLSAAVEGEDLTAAADVAATLEDLTAGLEPAR